MCVVGLVKHQVHSGFHSAADWSWIPWNGLFHDKICYSVCFSEALLAGWWWEWLFRKGDKAVWMPCGTLSALIYLYCNDACHQSLSRVWLGDCMDWSLPDSFVHGIFSRQEYWSGLPSPPPVYLQPRDQTRVSCIAGRFFTMKLSGKPPLQWRLKGNGSFLAKGLCGSVEIISHRGTFGL